MPPQNVPSSSKISIDITQLHGTLDQPLIEETNHLMQITNKVPISISQFKNMFYNNGDFLVSNSYSRATTNFIKNSVWGVKINKITFDIAIDASQGSIITQTNGSSGFLIETIKSSTIGYVSMVSGDFLNGAAIINGANVTISSTTEQWFNFNRLGGRNDNPLGIMMPYVYEKDVTRTFYPQIEIINNIERDSCSNKEKWTLCSRTKLWDSLYNLAFASEVFTYNELEICEGRLWKEVVNAIRDEEIEKNIELKNGDEIDLILEIKIKFPEECVKANIIKIRFRVLITNIGHDLNEE